MPAFYANFGRSDIAAPKLPTCALSRAPPRTALSHLRSISPGRSPKKRTSPLSRRGSEAFLGCVIASKPERAFRPWPIQESVAVQAATKAAVPWSALAAQQAAEAVSSLEAVCLPSRVSIPPHRKLRGPAEPAQSVPACPVASPEYCAL